MARVSIFLKKQTAPLVRFVLLTGNWVVKMIQHFSNEAFNLAFFFSYIMQRNQSNTVYTQLPNHLSGASIQEGELTGLCMWPGILSAYWGNCYFESHKENKPFNKH